jgi:hypothetical protein
MWIENLNMKQRIDLLAERGNALKVLSYLLPEKQKKQLTPLFL